jgi:tRNA-dihydrouridine synthase
MEIEFAPMEGITDDIFRRLHHKYFSGVGRYYTPFLSPAAGKVFSKKELREVLPENNPGVELVPQLLTNRAELFLAGAEILRDLGYREVNLNLGCPSGTVTAKGKGSGAIFPERRQALEEFLEEIFAKCPLKISIKTRLGKADPEEFSQLLELYNRYPIRRLTIHPRVQQDFYRKPVRMEWFFRAAAESKNPVALSGGIGCPADFRPEFEKFPMMLGRGLVADPSLAAKLQGQPGASRETLKAFVEELFQETAERLGNPRSTMFRMKEIWSFLILLFDDRDKCQKTLRKATSLTEYQAAVKRVFQLPLRDAAEVNWV